MNNLDNLLPCPFCSGGANMYPERDYHTNKLVGTFYVFCPKCDIGFYDNDELSIIKAWNTRADDANVVTNPKAADALDLVCILEDDAEPEPGDVVIAETTNYLDDGRLDFTSTSAEYYAGEGLHPFKVKKIIQRQGRPVIYRSQLTKLTLSETLPTISKKESS